MTGKSQRNEVRYVYPPLSPEERKALHADAEAALAWSVSRERRLEPPVQPYTTATDDFLDPVIRLTRAYESLRGSVEAILADGVPEKTHRRLLGALYGSEGLRKGI